MLGLNLPGTWKLEIGSDEWWEFAPLMLDRLYERWAYAATWARRQPIRKRALQMQRAWTDYYTALEGLSHLSPM